MDFKTTPNQRRMEGEEKWGWRMAVVLSKLPFPQECFCCVISSFFGRKSIKMIWHLAIVAGSVQKEWGEGDRQCTLWTLTRKVGYRAVPQQKIYLALHCCCFICCWCYPLFTFTLLCSVIASCLLPTPVATNAISGNNEWLQLVESLHGLQLLMCFPACCATAGALQISQWNQQHLLFFNLSSSKELFPISQQVLHRTKGMLYSSGRSQRDHFSIFP